MDPHARRENLIVQELDSELVIYDLERHRAHRLNESAALVWRHCDGRTSVDQLVRLLDETLHLEASREVVWLVLSRLEEAHLLRELLLRPRDIAPVSRRQAIALGLTGAAALLLEGCGVDTITTPTSTPASPGVGAVSSISGDVASTMQQGGRCICNTPLGTIPKPPSNLCATASQKNDVHFVEVKGVCQGSGKGCPNSKECTNKIAWKCKDPGGADPWDMNEGESELDVTKVCVTSKEPEPTPPPPPPTPTPEPTPTPPPPPPTPPPPPPDCPAIYPAKKQETIVGYGATQPQALNDLMRNGLQACIPVCAPHRCAVHPDHCVPNNPIFRGRPTCVTDDKAPANRRHACSQLLTDCNCRCGSF